MSWQEDSNSEMITKPIRIRARVVRTRDPYLIVLGGGVVGQTFPIAPGKAVIGRSRDAQVRIEHDSVSRTHAVIARDSDDQCTIADLGSSNGTWINDEPITDTCELHNGDRVQVGKRLFKFARHDQFERQLQEAQKMEAIGRLAGGIAHHFNNLLTVVMSASASLANILDGDVAASKEETRGIVDEIESAAARAGELTRQLLGFARRGKVHDAPVEIGKLVERIAELVRRTLDRSIEIETDVQPGLWVMGDDSEIEQMVLNLCLNAQDAMPDGGTLRIAADRSRPEPEGDVTLPGDLGGNEVVRIRVSDTGGGLDPDIVDRVFEPYFTLKSAGAATGLGLAMVYGAARNHGGHARLHKTSEAGTTFEVWLPAVTAPTHTRPTEHRAEPLAGSGRGTILVVDDEPAVRFTTERLLRNLGYQVMGAADGREGVEAYKAHRDRIDLVVLDLLMPRMSGEEAYRAMRKLDPSVRVIVCSGYDDGKAQVVLDEGANGFLRKPYRLREMASLVREVLEK